jgi:hypothetical protein
MNMDKKSDTGLIEVTTVLLARTDDFENKDVIIKFIRSEHQAADIQTKNTALNIYRKFSEAIRNGTLEAVDPTAMPSRQDNTIKNLHDKREDVKAVQSNSTDSEVIEAAKELIRLRTDDRS